MQVREYRPLISDADYPPGALRRGEQGTVRVLLDLSSSGAVEGCTIVRSSGSAALDQAACWLLRQRGRFLPGLAPEGRPLAERFGMEVVWILPRGP